VLIGLHAPDDAAVAVPPGKLMVHTRRLSSAPSSTTRTVRPHRGQPCAGRHLRHGRRAQSATAIATVPRGCEAKVEDTLFQMMSGRGVGAQRGRLRAGRRPHRRGRGAGLGFAVNGLIDATGRGDAQGRACARRRADPDQAHRHRHPVRRPHASAGQGPLDRRRARSRCRCPTSRRPPACTATVPPPAPTSPASACSATWSR
jgi:hypothetical protein